MEHEKMDTAAIDIIIRLRQQQKFEEDCLIRALQSIPEKYAKQLLKKYIELCEAHNG
jgi:histone H3/H4